MSVERRIDDNRRREGCHTTESHTTESHAQRTCAPDDAGDLIAKVAFVSVAAGLGGYNHFRLRPLLGQRPDDPALAKELRTIESIESIVFVVVLALTAVLVAAAT